MSRSSPSVLFTQYTDLFCDQTWGDMLAEFFGGICKKKKHLNVFLFLLNSSDFFSLVCGFFSSFLILLISQWSPNRPSVDQQGLAWLQAACRCCVGGTRLHQLQSDAHVSSDTQETQRLEKQEGQQETRWTQTSESPRVVWRLLGFVRRLDGLRLRGHLCWERPPGGTEGHSCSKHLLFQRRCVWIIYKKNFS